MTIVKDPVITNRLKEIPDVSGIYLYYNKEKELIYVGKATSLRSRIRSYFRGVRTPRPIEEMIHEVTDIAWKETESVLEAVILESVYIKKFLPKYNVLGKDNKSWNYILVSKDHFPKVITMRQHELALLKRNEPKKIREFAKIFGPYPGLNTKAAVKVLRKMFHFSSCEPGIGRPCLYYEMGQCLGVCVGKVTSRDYKQKVINPLSLFLSGKKKQVIKSFEIRMKKAAKAENFEEAAQLRNQLRELNRIHDVTLINKSFFEDEVVEQGGFLNGKDSVRIEGYDISNLGASDKVGSMVVFNRFGPVKSQYRKFLIKTVKGQNDIESLAEVLERRLKHLDWPLPDVILLDGGYPQVQRIQKLFIARGIEIPFLGIAKGPERKRNDIVLGAKTREFVQWVAKHTLLLVRVRDEAHRFAITFNRSKRKIK